MVDSCTPDDVLASMSEHIEVGPYVSVRQLEVLDSLGTYLAEGGFLPERMLKFWEGKARQSVGGQNAGSQTRATGSQVTRVPGRTAPCGRGNR